MKVQHLRAVKDAVRQIESKLAGYRVECWQGSTQASQMAVRQVIQVLCADGWIARDDAEVLIQELENICDFPTLSYTPPSGLTAMNADMRTLSEESL